MCMPSVDVMNGLICAKFRPCNPRVRRFGLGLHGHVGLARLNMWDVRNAACLLCKLPKCSVELESAK